MNPELTIKWLSGVHDWLYPPGCETSFVESPSGRSDMCCTVGIVHEHRFAFLYWAIFSNEKARRSPGCMQERPVLVTVDYHDDIGGDCDFDPKELEALNPADRTELGFFCWCRLRSLNDGQVAPALYLNMFSDVYVLLKQGSDGRHLCPDEASRQQQDRHGSSHTIRYFDRMADLLRSLSRDQRPIYLDIDLDYFTRDHEADGTPKGGQILVSTRLINEFFSLDGAFMSAVVPRLVGLTIALEPECCGGLAQCLKVLDILNKQMFDGSLCTDHCRWRVTPSKGPPAIMRQHARCPREVRTM